jgi:hypothetical protein
MRALALLAGIGVLLGGGGATAAAATQLKRYEAWTPGGNPRVAEFTGRRGDCNSSSYVSGTSDAWRCFVGSTILDPCFANPQSDREVLCVRSPWARNGVLVTSPLDPDDRLPGRSGPWHLVIRGGLRCGFVSGATTTVQGLRLNYPCGRRGPFLFGKPIRTRPAWRIRLSRNPDGPRLRVVPVRTAWR